MGRGVQNKSSRVKGWKHPRGSTSLESEGYGVSISEMECFLRCQTAQIPGDGLAVTNAVIQDHPPFQMPVASPGGYMCF